MASAEAFETWECAICADILDSPVILPCGCFFCSKHLSDHLITGTNTLKCPGCLKLHQVPEGGVSQFTQFNRLSQDLDAYTAKREKLQDLATKTETKLEERREKIERQINDINNEFDRVIENVEKRREKVVIPYKNDLKKLNELEKNLQITMSAMARSREDMEGKIITTEKSLQEMGQQLNEWVDKCEFTFHLQSQKLYDLIDSFGEIDHYVSYSIKSTIRGLEAEHRFNDPFDLAVCPITDRVYMTSTNAIIQLDNEGTIIKRTIMDHTPICITVDGKGRIIITIARNEKVHTIFIYDQNIRFMRSFTKIISFKWNLDIVLLEPCGVVTDIDDNMYTADTSKHLIMVFTPEGKYIRKFGSKELTQPRFLHISPDQKLFIIDSKSFVHVYTLTGEYERVFGKGILRRPRGLCIDERGYILVIDNCNQAIEVFTPDFIHFTSMKTLSSPTLEKIALTKSGNLIVTDYKENKVYVLRSFSLSNIN